MLCPPPAVLLAPWPAKGAVARDVRDGPIATPSPAPDRAPPLSPRRLRSAGPYTHRDAAPPRRVASPAPDQAPSASPPGARSGRRRACPSLPVCFRQLASAMPERRSFALSVHFFACGRRHGAAPPSSPALAAPRPPPCPLPSCPRFFSPARPSFPSSRPFLVSLVSSSRCSCPPASVSGRLEAPPARCPRLARPLRLAALRRRGRLGVARRASAPPPPQTAASRRFPSFQGSPSAEESADGPVPPSFAFLPPFLPPPPPPS